MGDCRPMATPMITNWKKIDASEDKHVDPTLYRQLIGSLMYLVNTRPDICYVVNTLSQFMVEPKRAHWAAAKHVLRKFNGLEKYLWVRFNIGSGMTSWCSGKEKFVAISSSEVEYMAASTASCEAIWLKKLLWFGEQSGGSNYETERQEISAEAEEADAEPEEAT
eukprot:PITA_31627